MKYFNISGAEAVTRALMEEGVDTVFGYPGGANLPIYDSFYKYKDKISHILVRHEQGAVHAAEGFAEAKRQTGVCMVTSGPGATNLLTGIADAMVDSVPIVCITGQVASPNLGYDAFQETDVVGFSMPVTKWNYQITKAEEISSVLAEAFYIAAAGRPGPVLIDITKNAQTEIIDCFEYNKCTRVRSYHPRLKPKNESVEEAAMILNNAKKPLMIVGHGVLISGCENQVKELAEKLSMPVASTLKGLSAFDCNHPLYIGMVGLHGNLAPNKMTNECDVLLAVGMRFADRVTSNVSKYARQAKIIHIEIDPSEVDKVVKSSVAIVSDAGSALKQLIPLLGVSHHPQWLDTAEKYRNIELDSVIKRDLYSRSDVLTMGAVVDEISRVTAGNALTVTDVGQNQMASARYFKYVNPRTSITSGGLGTMGFALPAAIGANFAQKDKPVVVITGDGGFQMTMEELGVVMQYNLPLKIVLLNNNFLGMIRQLQDLYYNSRYYFGELQNPDFVKIASAYNIPAVRITKKSELSDAVAQMFNTQGAFFLEATVEKNDNVYPVIPAGAGVDQMILTEKN